MPYVIPEQREKWRDPLNHLRANVSLAQPMTAGELNYLITQVALLYLSTNGKKYETLNAAVGALECAKQELYRRVLAPYESIKISINGDVYP